MARRSLLAGIAQATRRFARHGGRLRKSARPAAVVLLVAIALLVALRVALPFIATHYANQVLATLPGHEGHIEDVDLQIWRGAYSIHGLRIDQIDDQERQLLFLAPDTHFSLDWSALFRGHIVANVEVRDPIINVVTEAKPDEIKEEKLRLEDLVDRFRELVPFVVGRFALVNGELHFYDKSTKPPINLYVERLHVVARNLTNSEEVAQNLWATVSGSGRVMGSGKMQIEMRLNPNEPQPTYELAFELQDLRLPALNAYLKHYLSVEARDGRLSLFAESTAKEGRFTGYAKPVVRDLDILRLKQEPKSVGEAVKGLFVKLIAGIFENEPKEQLATRVEFSGKFENPNIGVWEAAVSFIRNAFVQALRPGLDASVAPQQAEKAKGKPGDKQKRESP